MKHRYTTLVFLGLTAICNAQTTPLTTATHPSPTIIGARDVECDTVDFYGLTDGTTVTDQYLSCGAIFLNSVSIDYGVDTYGSTIHSPSWVDPLEVHFVDPDDGITPRPVQHVSFKNIVDPAISSGEIDYVTAYAYDADNNVVAWTWGTSPAFVEITLSAPLITRVVIDDTMGTAYALDDFVFDGVVTTGITSPSNSSAFTVFPNPVNDVVHVQCARGSDAVPAFAIMDLNGRELLRPVAFAEATGWRLALPDLAAGPYLLRMSTREGTHTQGLIKQ